MTTISPNRKRFRERTRFFVLLGVLVLVLVLVGLAREPLASLFWSIAAPLSKAQSSSSASLGNFFSSFSSNQTLASENARLRAELASSSITMIDRDLLWSENVELKSRLGRPGINTPRILAAVVARPPQVPYDTLMLDAGADAGIAVEDLVSAGGSAFVGRVSNVYPTTARVVLFSSPGESYQAILTRAGTTTLAISVSGQGGGSLVSEVPAGTVVHIGDLVLFSSLMPQIIARVVAVEEGDASSFKKIYMQLAVSPSVLNFVEVYRAPQGHAVPITH